MSGLKRTFVIGAAFILPPLVAALLGLRALARRDHPATPARLGAEVIASAPRPSIDATRPVVVVLLGADLTEITDALAPYEMFARAGRYTVVTAAPERQPTLLSGGLRILPHYSLAELDRQLAGRAPAIVLVPNIPNIASAANRPLVTWMQRQAAAGALMHSWCKGAMALAHAGLLDGRTATAHWGDIASLEQAYPKVEWVRGVRWIDHGRIVLSAGITSGIDASLRVIARLDGDSVARRVAAGMRYPDYRYVIDPATEQYDIKPADAVLLANAAFRLHRPLLGIALYDGVGETDLSNVYDAHVHTMVAEAEAVSGHGGIVTTAHGLTLLPSLALPGAPSRARALDRLMIPGTDGRRLAASLVASAQGIAPALRAEYLHDDRAGRFGLAPVLEDLARTADRATAAFALRRMEYRAGDVQLQGSSLPWPAIATAILLGLLGVALLAGFARLGAGLRRVAAAAALLLAPAALEAQALASLPAGTRIRADLQRADVSRIRRIVAQPLTGSFAGMAGDTLLLAVKADLAPLRIPEASLRTVHVSRGRPGRVRSALRSAVVPALLGAAMRGLSANVSRRDGDPSPGQAALRGALAGGAFAGLRGAIFPAERWQRIVARSDASTPRPSPSHPVARTNDFYLIGGTMRSAPTGVSDPPISSHLPD